MRKPENNLRHILIYNQVRGGAFTLSAKDDILKGEIVCTVKEDRIVISRATLMSEKTLNPTLGRDGWSRVSISRNVRPGRFLICEDESTDDEIVAFFEDEF